ncbi:hypothetical protein Corgl_0011 [Coriobacterium glomerans PW2]|uniref:DUF4176 domain-containing protein n=2 Tax=Coriobacterium TaxID=33870 RepID=F2N6U2_CORGP|nr:hypothetical protein Corgl_0011 [Coriobacterium glomerans PW2]
MTNENDATGKKREEQHVREVNWLPIGSVVMLEAATRPIMIAGTMVQDTTTGRYWDYMGYPYPEGRVDPKQDYFFDTETIRTVVQLGFADQDGLSFQRFLQSNMEKYEHKRNEATL